MNNPALWIAISGCITAVAGLVTAMKAHTKINDHYANDHLGNSSDIK